MCKLANITITETDKMVLLENRDMINILVKELEKESQK